MAEIQSDFTAPSRLNLDDILISLGGFGKFQILLMIQLSVISIAVAISEFTYVITSSEVKHRCLIPGCETLSTASYNASQPWLTAAIPFEEDYGDVYCNMFNQTDSFCTSNSFSNVSLTCDTFVYETDEWTLAREDWGFECDSDTWQLTMLGSLNNGGMVLGGIGAGFLSDKLGRRFMLIYMSVLAMLLGLIKTFSVNYPMMLVLEFFEAASIAGVYNNCFVQAVEMVEPGKRVLVATIISAVYPIGVVLLGGIQWATLYWRTTLQILYIPCFMIFIFRWTMPESVRWLLSNNRREEAVQVFKDMAKMNGKPLPDDVVALIMKGEITTDSGHGGGESLLKSLKSILKSTRMRYRFLFNLIMWMGTVFVYFAMTLNSVSFSENKFEDFMLTGAIEIPATFLTMLLLDRFGRRICLSTMLVLCGICNICSDYTPDGSDWSWVKLVLYLAAKFSVTGAFMTMDVYTAEMFPTPIRAGVMSICLMFGKLGAILAPQIRLLADFYDKLPLLVFASLAFIASFAALTFPETFNTILPDTVEEAEQLGRNTAKRPEES